MRKSSVCKEWVVYFAVALCCQLEVLHSFFAFSVNAALLLLGGVLFWILYKEKLVRHIIYLLNMYLRLYGRDGRAGLIWLPVAGVSLHADALARCQRSAFGVWKLTPLFVTTSIVLYFLFIKLIQS